jgi:hypothetical protein
MNHKWLFQGWLYQGTDHSARGPVSTLELRAMVAAGALRPGAKVWYQSSCKGETNQAITTAANALQSLSPAPTRFSQGSISRDEANGNISSDGPQQARQSQTDQLCRL